MSDEKELTFGQKEVGVTFNPSGNEKVARVKQLMAEVIDILNEDRGDRRDNGARWESTGITEVAKASMVAVKGLTFPPES